MKCHYPVVVVMVLVLVVYVGSTTDAGGTDAGGTDAGGTGYNRRMTPEEREEIFRRMEATFNQREEPPCVPPTQPPTNSKPLPTVPKSFTTKVEITFQEENKKRVLYGAEAFDGIFNTGVLRYEMGEGVVLHRPYALEEIIHYNVPEDEALFIITDTACEDTDAGNCDPKKNCHASNLEGLSAELQEIFGFGDANGHDGFYGAGGILQWGPQYDYEYQGKSNCRGLTCDKYQACITNPDEEATVRLTYYWSAEDWEVTTNSKPVPVALEVYATGKYGQLFSRKVAQRYDFYEFMRDLRPGPDELMPPADVYCTGRVNLYDPPQVPHYFSYSSEAVTSLDMSFPTGDNQTENVELTFVSTYTEHYDWDSKIVAVDFSPWFILGEMNRYEYDIRRVQDFQQGLVYYILKHMDKCQVKPIENITSAGDIVVGDHGSVSLMPPWIFEGMDEPMQYNGLHWARGVPADVWIGLKKILDTSLHQDFVWYYASPLTLDETLLEEDPNGRLHRDLKGVLWSNLNERIEERLGRQLVLNDVEKANPKPVVSMDKVPLRLERYINILSGLPHLIYNIYDYQAEPPMTHTIDISLCYKDSQMRSFTVDLPPDSLVKVHQQWDKLMYSAQQALAEVAVVSPLRINRMALEEGVNRPRLLFTILEKSEVIGTAPGSQLESDMVTAIKHIRATIDSSQLVIVVHLQNFTIIPEKPSPVTIVAVPGSMREVTRGKGNNYSYSTSKGYHPGDMAGLAIGMLLMGALLGVVINMVIQKSSAAQGGLSRLSMARKARPSVDTTININADLTGSDI